MPQPIYRHQITKLSPGKHHSPQHGACVMELASMLAGETFSDRPRSVSPTIGGLLRAYNDRVPDDLRQDLYRYAAEVVGTQAPQSVEDERLRRVLEWGEQTRADRRRRLISLPRRPRPDQRGKSRRP